MTQFSHFKFILTNFNPFKFFSDPLQPPQDFQCHFKFFIDPLQPLQVSQWPTSTTSSFSVTHFNHFKFFSATSIFLLTHFNHFKFFLTHFNHFKFIIDPLQPLQVYQWPTSTTSSFSGPLQVFYWPTSTTPSFLLTHFNHFKFFQ